MEFFLYSSRQIGHDSHKCSHTYLLVKALLHNEHNKLVAWLTGLCRTQSFLQASEQQVVELEANKPTNIHTYTLICALVCEEKEKLGLKIGKESHRINWS